MTVIFRSILVFMVVAVVGVPADAHPEYRGYGRPHQSCNEDHNDAYYPDSSSTYRPNDHIKIEIDGPSKRGISSNHSPQFRAISPSSDVPITPSYYYPNRNFSPRATYYAAPGIGVKLR